MSKAVTLIVNGVLDHTNSRLPENKLTSEKLVALAEQQGVDIINVTEVVISAAFWSIGRECFKDLQLLENVVCPDTLLFIEEKAFAYCSGLKTINIPENVESIGEEAFLNCRRLQKVDIPTIDVIEARTFARCELLTEISIPVTVKHIKEEAFEDCDKLAKINFSESGALKKLGDKAFKACALEELVLYDGVEEIGEEAFERCTSLWTAKIPDTVKRIEASAFFRCSLRKLEFPKYLEFIGTYAFWGNSFLETLTIPNSVHTIGASAFAENLSLTTFTFPNNLQEISDGLFSGCVSLRTAIIPNSVQEIGSGAFENCRDLHTIAKRIHMATGPKHGPSFGSLVHIRGEAFRGCSSLVEIPVMHSLVRIGHRAFYKCTNLIAVTLGSKLEQIMKYAFRACPNLLVILVPNSSIFIDKGAFQDCPNLWVIAPYEYRTTLNKDMFSPKALLPLEDGVPPPPPEPFKIQQYLPSAEGRSDVKKSALQTYMEWVKGHSLMLKQYIISYNKAQIFGGPKAVDTVNEAAKLVLRVQYCDITTHTEQSSLTRKQLEWLRTVYLIFKRNELASLGEFATHQSEDTLEVQISTPPEIVRLILSWIAMQLMGPADYTVPRPPSPLSQVEAETDSGSETEAQMVAPRTFNDNVR